MKISTHCKTIVSLIALAVFTAPLLGAREPDTVLDLWPGQPPGPAMDVGPEQDFTKPTDRLIAGRRIIKLGNVRTPQVHVFRPPPTAANGAAVVVCPGGGFNILAWDLEGTEVADWLNALGVTALVLKYRVPTRTQDPMWRAPVQDAQRAMRLTRHHAKSWQVDPDRVGILGFSAGAHTAARTTLMPDAQYEPIDAADKQPFKPNFTALIYPGGLINKEKTTLPDDLVVPDHTPPVFFAQAFDDPVRVENSLLLALELKRHDISCEVHLYSEGGHGYGLRETAQPVTTWHHRCAEWMQVNDWIGQPLPEGRP